MNVDAQRYTPRYNVRGGKIDAPTGTTASGRRGFIPRRQKIALDAQLTAQRFNIAGNAFWVTSASGSDAIAQVQFVKGSDVSDLVDIAQGFRAFGVDFDYILVTTASAQASKYLIVTYGDAPPGFEADTI